MSLIDLTLGLNDRLPEIAVTFRDDNGAIDLSAATLITFTLQNAATGAYKLSAVTAFKVDDGTTALRGKAKYTPASGDLDTAGLYKAWFTATIGGKFLTAPKRAIQPFLVILIV